MSDQARKLDSNSCYAPPSNHDQFKSAGFSSIILLASYRSNKGRCNNVAFFSQVKNKIKYIITIQQKCWDIFLERFTNQIVFFLLEHTYFDTARSFSVYIIKKKKNLCFSFYFCVTDEPRMGSIFPHYFSIYSQKLSVKGIHSVVTCRYVFSARQTAG